MTTKERINKAYIESKLSGIFEPMVVQLIQDKPANIVRIKTLVSFESAKLTVMCL